jgi:hypothetical protein
MSSKSTKILRIQLDLPEEKVAELDQLMKEISISTRKDLFNIALSVLNWVVNETKEERIVASVNKERDSYKELRLPFSASVQRPEPTTDSGPPD